MLLAFLLFTLPAAAQPSRPVAFTGQVVEAWNQPQPQSVGAPVPETLVKELQRTFQFKQYRLLGTVSGTATVGSTWSGGVGGVTVEATPQSVDASTINLDVRLLRGGSPVVTSKVRLTPGGQVAVGGSTAGGGGLIVVLTGR